MKRSKLLLADRRVRGSIAALIVLASAGSGFLASRFWPLATPPAPTLKVASSDASRPLADGKVPETNREPADAPEKPAGVSFVLLNPGTAEQPRDVEHNTPHSTAKKIG